MSENRAGARRTLVLLALTCIIPVAAGYLALYGWRPATTVNYGDLLPLGAPTPLRLNEHDGRDFDLSQLRGKWLLVTIDSGACDDYCQEKLTYVRQLRLTQGKDSDRIERVWLITDEVRPASGFIPQFEGTRHLFANPRELTARFPASNTARDHIYVVDPQGNVILRFPRNPNTKGMIKDITRLLRVSRVG
jgi:cytochrome oxidase Cu insertion factor (SCO1/SenC/PrrC family)